MCFVLCRFLSIFIFLFQGIKVFQLFDGKLQRLLLQSEDCSQKKASGDPSEKKALEEKRKMIENEIDSWIDLLMKGLLSCGNSVSNSDLIGKVLEECEKSHYMRQTATNKVWVLANLLTYGIYMRSLVPPYHLQYGHACSSL